LNLIDFKKWDIIVCKECKKNIPDKADADTDAAESPVKKAKVADTGEGE